MNEVTFVFEIFLLFHCTVHSHFDVSYFCFVWHIHLKTACFSLVQTVWLNVLWNSSVVTWTVPCPSRYDKAAVVALQGARSFTGKGMAQTTQTHTECVTYAVLFVLAAVCTWSQTQMGWLSYCMRAVWQNLWFSLACHDITSCWVISWGYCSLVMFCSLGTDACRHSQGVPCPHSIYICLAAFISCPEYIFWL